MKQLFLSLLLTLVAFTANAQPIPKQKTQTNQRTRPSFTRTITINYNEYVKALAKLDEDDPERTLGDSDLLLRNIKNHWMKFMKDGILTIVVDEDNAKIYVGGELITDDVDTIWPKEWGKDTPTSIKMYRQILNSIDFAERWNFYEKVFTETLTQQ